MHLSVDQTLKSDVDDDSRSVVDHLCKYIYTKDSTDRIRTRAILCHIYHHALHGRWYEARDLMLMSHLQDSIQHSDIPTQVCFGYPHAGMFLSLPFGIVEPKVRRSPGPRTYFRAILNKVI